MDDFKRYSVKSGQREDDNERLCAVEHRLRLEIFQPQRVSYQDLLISRPALTSVEELGLPDKVLQCHLKATSTLQGYGIDYNRW